MRLVTIPALALLATSSASVASEPPPLASLVADYLWSGDETVRDRAAIALSETAAYTAATRSAFASFERLLERSRPDSTPLPPREGGVFRAQLLTVTLPDGREMPVFVQLPPDYDPERAWPTILAMHGGPTASPEQSMRGAMNMLDVWLEPAKNAGWIVISPAMTHVVAAAPRTEERLPYEILRADQMEAMLRAVGQRYHLDPDRIVSTGISLGSNFSIAYAASRPARFAGIVPVSTEGESREHLLRNLMHVPTFVLEGARDRNVRSVDGARALDAILERFGYDHVYREFSDRAHEGFQEVYPEVLRWLEARPREPFPAEILRVPHRGIVPLAKRVHWIEADTRQALVRAKAIGNRIDIEARWARKLHVYLHDRLVNLDEPIQIRVNGVLAYEGRVDRSIPFALEQVRALDDLGRPFAGRVTVAVSESLESVRAGVRLTEDLAPQHPEGALSFWETYAIRALMERFPSLEIEGVEVADPKSLGLGGELTAIRLTTVEPDSPFAAAGVKEGDLLLEVGGEPFFAGHGLNGLRGFDGLDELYRWLVLELDGVARPYPVVVRRDGVELTLEASLALGSYRE